MILATPIQMPVPGVPDAQMLERAAKRGVAGMGSAWDDPGAFAVQPGGSVAMDMGGAYDTDWQTFSPSQILPAGAYVVGGQSIQFYGGSTNDLAKALAPVVPGVMNLLTNIYSPPAYRTVTGPGGSTTEIRYPAGATGMTPTNNPLAAAGINTTTLMMLGVGVVVVMMVMGRR